MTDNNKNSVLIVDDEVPNIMILSRILKADFTVHALKNGSETLETAKRHLPDVILLDIVMPETDGYQIIAELKACEQTRDIPVIFISGLSEVENEQRGLSLGAADYIAKPFSPAIVNFRVKNQIEIMNYKRGLKTPIDEIVRLSRELSRSLIDLNLQAADTDTNELAEGINKAAITLAERL